MYQLLSEAHANNLNMFKGTDVSELKASLGNTPLDICSKVQSYGSSSPADQIIITRRTAIVTENVDTSHWIWLRLCLVCGDSYDFYVICERTVNAVQKATRSEFPCVKDYAPDQLAVFYGGNQLKRNHSLPDNGGKKQSPFIVTEIPLSGILLFVCLMSCEIS